MKNVFLMMRSTLKLPRYCFYFSVISGILVGAVIISGCKGGNADRNGVDSAMNINDQKIEDSATTVSSGTAEFVVKAANGGMTEVQAAQIAQQKAGSNEVKQFASKMVEDHTKLNDQLKSIASSLNITVPSAIDADSKSMIDKLNNAKAVDFDKTFIDMMVKAHDNDADLFEKGAKDIANAQLHTFITEALPIIQSHREMAKNIQASVK